MDSAAESSFSCGWPVKILRMANMEKYQCIDLEGVVVVFGAEYDYPKMSTWAATGL